MVTRQSIFKYKTIKGPLHKLPVMIKFFLFIFISFFCLTLSPLLLGLSIVPAIITAFFCRFTLSEQLTDLKPVIFYASLMYMLSVFSNFFESFEEGLTFYVLLPHSDYLNIVLRLFFIVQLSSLLFRTTSNIELRECLNSIERFIKYILSTIPVLGKKINHENNRTFSDSLSLFICFIPEIFSTWTALNLSWKARGGKNGFNKITTLVFSLISLCFVKASVKAKALQARGGL